MKLTNNNKKGFTLIELVLTIAVLAILAAIAIPTVVSILHSARESADLSNANELEYSIKTYIARIDANMIDADRATVSVGEALREVNVDTPLECTQPGYHFYYNAATQDVICLESNANQVEHNALSYALLTEGTSDSVPLFPTAP